MLPHQHHIDGGMMNGMSSNQHASNGSLVNGDPKFYHYCYVCNTQLNSCKQALLHCSGKRHKKKLQFLQSRKHTVGASMGATSGSVTPAPAPVYATHNYNQQNGILGSLPHHHAAIAAHNHYFPPGLVPSVSTADGSRPTWMIGPPTSGHNPQYINAAQPTNNPHVRPVLMQQLDCSAMQLQQQPQQQMSATYVMHAPLQQCSQQQPNVNLHSYSPSPLLLTDSSYSGGLRSAVISPSETSSISSDPSQPSQRRQMHVLVAHASNTTTPYRCAVCHSQFTTGALLHQHLQAANHFKPHSHSFYAGEGNASIKRTGDSSETESSHSTGLYYCSVCSIAVNSQAQLHSHNNGRHHRARVQGDTKTRSVSRASSTSSETDQTARDTQAESGYTSGSGDDSIRCVSDGEYVCQPCCVTLRSKSDVRLHLDCPRHQQRVLNQHNKSFRRKTQGSIRRKSAANAMSTTTPVVAKALQSNGVTLVSPCLDVDASSNINPSCTTLVPSQT